MCYISTQLYTHIVGAQWPAMNTNLYAFNVPSN